MMKKINRLSRRKLIFCAALLVVAAVSAGAAVLTHKKTAGPAAGPVGPPPKLITSATKPPAASAPSSKKTKTQPPKTASTPNNVLFFDGLSGPDRIVTNEYVHWNPGSACPYSSSKWDMTSGTLMVKNGAGYSGIPTSEQTAVCNSSVKNNSAVFRLTTKALDFGDTTTTMDYKLVSHGAAGVSNNSYDGLHIWVRYQSQYGLYAVSVARWDGVMVIKKKVPQSVAHCGDPSDGGCYYDLAPPVTNKALTSPDVWHHAAVTVSNQNGKVTIELVIDGHQIVTAIDSGRHGPVYAKGAAGVRGDNTEFYFKNFTITKI